MNAKLLIELPGVEAGSKECGECRRIDRMIMAGNRFGAACNMEVFRNQDNLQPALDVTGNGSILRCPACLAAEEAANSIGTKKEE
jgi:hypothetical protein